MLKGSCLCGAVRVTVADTLHNPVACHCGQCRKATGNHVVSGRCPEAEVTIEGEVRWYTSSPGARRGFCPTCGSQMFWKLESSPNISVALGMLDGETGLALTGHIYCADKGDWEEIPDSEAAPRWEYGDLASDAKPWRPE
ncbi:GFA family protein [Rhodovulum sp. DZ06]|uniref:GFA family protein n=1 Tax=Rhodovulum sp. DZ06 TaxID=3425126 RepID=UPI003D33D261